MKHFILSSKSSLLFFFTFVLGIALYGGAAAVQLTQEDADDFIDAVLSCQDTGITHYFQIGGSPDCKDKEGRTALRNLACWPLDTCHLRIAEELIKRGATVDAKDAEGLTPLDVAYDCTNMYLAKLLLTHGADRKGSKGRFTPLHLAALLGDTAGAKLALQ